MKKPVVELDVKELEALVDAAATRPLAPEECGKLKKVIHTLHQLTGLIEKGKVSLKRLQRMLFGLRTEKTGKVCKHSQADETEKPAPAPGQEKDKPKGHGRNGAGQYTGATRIRVDHDQLTAGQRCPDCQKGKLYASLDPSPLVRLKGQAPIGATVWELERMRCNLCGQVYTAQAPQEVGTEKYDPSVAATIGMHKYGCGFPFHRLQQLQAKLGIPLPSSTQWEIVSEAAVQMAPALVQLLDHAAQGQVLYNDDTGAKVLSLLKAVLGPKERTGVFTSAVISTGNGHRIALFFTGRQHAGENLAQVLQRRRAELAAPIHMCDALSRNVPADAQVISAHCNAHARRKFVEIEPLFPKECRHVLEIFQKVYHNDAIARDHQMDPQQRLTFHQEQSGPLMQQLKHWLAEQTDRHLTEPNSTLGEAIGYMKKHWDRLTRFLHVPKAPLDNNITERALKKAILHRKAALFFKTLRGAWVADLFMSLIHTTEINGGNPPDYITQLLTHADKLAKNPAAWMPWNYRETLAGLESPSPAPS